MRAPVAGLAFASLACGASAQQVLWDQQWDGISESFLSQDTMEDFSTRLFDDVDLPAPWVVNRVTVYGEEMGVAGTTTAIHLRFSQYHNYTAPGAVPAHFDSLGATGLQGNVLTLGGVPGDGTPLGLGLPLGHWYLSVWVDRSFHQGGQWNWRGRRPVSGVEAWAHILGGTGPPLRPISDFTGGPPVDLSFRIEGFAVPEPVSGMVLGLAALAMWRRRCGHR